MSPQILFASVISKVSDTLHHFIISKWRRGRVESDIQISFHMYCIVANTQTGFPCLVTAYAKKLNVNRMKHKNMLPYFCEMWKLKFPKNSQVSILFNFMILKLAVTIQYFWMGNFGVVLMKLFPVVVQRNLGLCETIVGS